MEAAGLNENEMALIIKRFKTALKGRKEYSNKNKAKGKCSCFKCGKTGHFIAQCPDNENDQGDERESVPASSAVRQGILLLNVPIMKMTRETKDMGRRRRRKAIGRLKARHIMARNGTRTAHHPTLMMKDWQPRPSISLRSSPRNATLASWLRRRR